MNKVLCIGQATCDITLPIDAEIKDNHKFTIYQEIVACGGPAMTAACVCGKWQTKTDLISRIGNDANGNMVQNMLHKFNVASDKLIVRKDYTTPYSYIFVNQNNGNRTIFNNPGTNDAQACESVVSDYKVILTDGRDLEMSFKSFEANPLSKKVIDAGTCRKTTLDIAKMCDYLICSKYFAEQYTGSVIKDDFSNIASIFNAVEKINGAMLAITLGDRGLVYRNALKQIVLLPAYTVKAMDTTGAGDIFHGAFAWAISEGKDELMALKLASVTAALSTRSFGGQASIPELEEVLHICEEWNPEEIKLP